MIVEIPPIEIIRRYHKQAPVDVLQLASNLMMSIRSEKVIAGSRANLVKPPMGSMAEFHLSVAEDATIGEARLIVAVAIAHLVLHKSILKRSDFWAFDGNYDTALPHENCVKAKHLALWILMPDHLMAELLRAGFTTPEALASSFQVSEGLVHLRLDQMKSGKVSDALYALLARVGPVEGRP